MHEAAAAVSRRLRAGGLLFGIVLFRAGVLARCDAALLAIGTTTALALSARA